MASDTAISNEDVTKKLNELKQLINEKIDKEAANIIGEIKDKLEVDLNLLKKARENSLENFVQLSLKERRKPQAIIDDLHLIKLYIENPSDENLKKCNQAVAKKLSKFPTVFAAFMFTLCLISLQLLSIGMGIFMSIPIINILCLSVVGLGIGFCIGLCMLYIDASISPHTSESIQFDKLIKKISEPVDLKFEENTITYTARLNLFSKAPETKEQVHMESPQPT